LAVKGPVHAVSLYPEPRVYGEALYAGQTLDVPLAPYETVVLSFATGDAPQGLPTVSHRQYIVFDGALTEPDFVMRSVVYDEIPQPYGADCTSLVPASGRAVEIDTDFDIRLAPTGSAGIPAGSSVPSPRVRILTLFEGTSVPEASGTLQVDGKDVPLRAIRSDAGFTATGIAAPECWQFLEGVLPEEGVKVSLRASTQDPNTTVSVWLIADSPGKGTPDLPNALPSPEWISLECALLLGPPSATDIVKEVRKTAPVEKIDGVFLDTVEPVSVKQDFGELGRNRSVWDKEIVVGGQHFRRGLGSHANGEIVYNLDGKYRSFQAWAGPDMATNGSMGFTVLVDGQKRWESGRMVRGDAAKQVKVDITNARELRLVVDDGGDNIMGDHADWAEARLLK
jgi:hypothetical protein